MTGVGDLMRFALRRDRIRLPLWVLLLAVLVMETAASWDRLYPSPEERIQLLAILSGNPALSALLGPLTNPLSTGALTEWRINSGVLLVLALINIFTITRHVRAEEQSGRAEMLMVAPFSRRAPLWAALLVTLLADVVFVILAAALMAAVGIELSGSLVFAAAVASCAWVFAGIAAVTNQIFRSSRAANATAGAALALLWAVSALGNTQQNWIVWASPFGWAQQTDAFGVGRWWVVPIAVAVTIVLVAVAVGLNARRDLGGALVASREGRATASPRLTGVHALAWRLERPVLIAWACGFLFLALFVGFSRNALFEFTNSSPQLAQIIERLGGTGAIVDVFLATYIGMSGVAAGFLAVSAVLRLESEEKAGHAEEVLATATRRSSWASSYLVLAIVGPLAVLVVLGVVLGVMFGVQGDQGLTQVAPVTAAAVSWLAPVFFMAGLTLALVGLLPRWAALAWGVMSGFAVITEFGAVFGLPGWLMNLSPFSHLAKAPAESIALTPIIWLTVAGLLMAAAGYIGMQTRDLRSTG